MLRNCLAALALLVVATYAKECYVTPCTRDIVLALDSSKTMQSTQYVAQQIDFVSSMTASWTLSPSAARVAIFGYLFADDYQFSAYFTTQDTLSAKYSKLRTQSNKGIFNGNFSEVLWLLHENYATGATYAPRSDVQKRMVVFTSETNSAAIAGAAVYSQKIAAAGFSLSIVSLAAPQSSFGALTYNKFFSLPLASLTTSEALKNQIVDNAICNWDANRPTTPAEICTTSTTTTTRKPTTQRGQTMTTKTVPITHTPILTEAAYLNCSCYQQNVWLDIVFAIDVSKSMGNNGLVQVKADITSLVAQMTIDWSADRSIRVGFVTFAGTAQLATPLTAVRNQDDFINALWNDIQVTNIEAVDLEDALRVSSNAFNNGGRAHVKDVIVIYSSAYSNTGEKNPVSLSVQLKESGIQIITVAFVEAEESTIVLTMGELASPRMNFTSFKNPDLIGQIQDAFCQCNCFCPNMWHQLVIRDRKFGECYFLTEIDSIWKAAQQECRHMLSNDGMLVYINSNEKELTIFDYAEQRKKSNEWFGDQSFHIGLNYDVTSKGYLWDTVGGQDSTYVNWDVGYPNLASGNCVRAIKVGELLKWRNEDCVSGNTKAMCMSITCDTENFCGA